MQSSTRTLSRPAPRDSAALKSLFPYGLVFVVALYLLVSGQTLLILRWHYVGGGAALQKIHPATYLLACGLFLTLVFHSHLRHLMFYRISSDPLLLSFLMAVIFTAGYDVSLGGASFAPFVDTFVMAIATTVVLLCVPYSALLVLRRIVDLFFIFNIVMIFAEMVLHQNFLAPYISAVVRTPEESVVLGGFDDGRLSALFGHPLNAALLFGVYSIANLVSVPMRLSTTALARLTLSIFAYLAIFPTESRASMAVTGLILAFYLMCFGVGIVARGRVSPIGLGLAMFIVLAFILAAMGLSDMGFFDKMLLRFQYDYGSALSRDYALQILQSISDSALWFGLSQTELSAVQQQFNLIAIEISWVNFILVGGLLTTIPLFLTLCLFLFGSLPKYCYFRICFVWLLVLESTFASNSIWAKSATITNSLIVAIAMLRRHDLTRGTPLILRPIWKPRHPNKPLKSSHFNRGESWGPPGQGIARRLN